MKNIESLFQALPDPESARRFYNQLTAEHPAQAGKLLKNEGLLSDVTTIFSFSPLLAQTVLQNPVYISWLNRHRSESGIRDKSELLESLAQFSLTNSQLEPQILLARFRRRELVRIFLHDIRRLTTIAEITEEISNLADAILEYALRLAGQEMDNRYGVPLETDGKNRTKPANFCVVSLGKLGSKELNYSSDIDLLFIYSAEGETSGKGAKGAVTNREYFVKLAEFVTKLVGQQTGEGAAYRVDLRLRPHGRVGALALSVADTVRYYQTEARAWERQVLIRSRSSAGEARLYKKLHSQTVNLVFSADVTVADALENVRLSKEQINLQHQSKKGFNVKLGTGGIREIEFIAQALQLAHGGRDEWLRASHTLISLTRIADRKLISARELTELFDAYEFLRRVEHLLQMENGLQTHTVPEADEKRTILARKMRCRNLETFDAALSEHAAHVNRIFIRVFGAKKSAVFQTTVGQIEKVIIETPDSESLTAKTERVKSLSESETLAQISPEYAQKLSANADLIDDLPAAEQLKNKNYAEILLAAIPTKRNLAARLTVLRRQWSRLLTEILLLDAFGKIAPPDAKILQTKLAEAAVETALEITKNELERRFSVEMHNFPLAILGLGKLGGGGLDYESDLDLILVYDDELDLSVGGVSHAEFYARAVEIFVNVLSGFTRDGYLYRVDLRLRPDGKNGATSIGKTTFFSYLQTRSAVWEWLAYVKIRAVGGDFGLAGYVEKQTRRIIGERVCELRNNGNQTDNLAAETLRIRERLEAEKSSRRVGKQIDIKFGAGGMLDIYFAVRFLQLRDDIPDDAKNRSTTFTLGKLHENKSLSREHFESFSGGYEFLSALDHQLRLTVGRSTQLPLANRQALTIIARRMKCSSIENLLEQLTVHRLNIRASFQAVVAV